MLKLGTITKKIPYSKAYLGDKLVYSSAISYLKSTGTQYLVIDYMPVQGDEITIENLVCPTSGATAYQSIFSAGNGTYQLIYLISYGASPAQSGYLKYFAAGNAPVITLDWKLDSPTNVYLSAEGVLYYNSNAVVRSTYAGAVDTKLHIFNRANNSQFAIAKMGKFTIKNNGVTKVELIPMLDDNNRPCMYDNISNRYYYNEGTGEFLYG